MGHLFERTTELACVLVRWVESQGGVSLMETHIWLPPMPASWIRGRTQKGRKMAEEAALPASPEADSPVLSGMFLALSSCWPGLEPTLGASVSQEVLCGPLEQHLEPSLSS